MTADEWLTKQEWSMGNGQCPECHGARPGYWYPHPCFTSADQEGHKQGCGLAEVMKQLGRTPQFAAHSPSKGDK
jgi:hypothetical protein